MADRYPPRKKRQLGMGDYFTVVAAQLTSTSLEPELAEEPHASQQGTVRVAVSSEPDAMQPLMPSSGGDPSQNIQTKVSSCSTASDQSQSHSQPAPIDIGIVLRKVHGGEKASDWELRQCLENRWSPSNAKDLPYSMKGSEKRYLGANHLQNTSWLAVSKVEGFSGAWCAFCSLFSVTGKGGGHHSSGGMKLGALVLKPLQRFSKLTGKDGDLTTHSSNQYHLTCAVKANEFLKRSATDSALDVRNMQDQTHRQAVLKNREKLRSIVDTILLCGRQNLALRGHRDSGRIQVEEPDENDGNFRALLRYRMRAGDTTVEEHFRDGPGNALYSSPKVQNELLDIALQMIREDIAEDVRKATCWTLIADETTDRAKRELMVMVLRYITVHGDKTVEIHEDPVYLFDVIEFISSHTGITAADKEIRLTGVNLATVFSAKCNAMGLDKAKCVAQGLDGASNLSSEIVGAAVEFQKEAPLANYYHCMMHALNLCASQSVKVQLVRSCLDVVSQLANFFNSSTKRHNLLDAIVAKSDDNDAKTSTFRKLCETRFVERHDAILTALYLLPHAQAALETMSEWEPREARTVASALAHSIDSFQFIVTLQAVAKMSSMIIGLSRSLQKPGIDIIKALTMSLWLSRLLSTFAIAVMRNSH
jgi:hypothetical protein